MPQSQNIQAQLPPGRTQLQITSGNSSSNANASAGSSRNQPNRNLFYKRPFKPFNTRAHQAGLDTDDQENQPQEDQLPDGQDQYDSYEDAFYQGVNWAQANANQDEQPESQDTHNENQGTVESYFANPLVTKRHICRQCLEGFKSNNALHSHLRAGCQTLKPTFKPSLKPPAKTPV